MIEEKIDAMLEKLINGKFGKVLDYLTELFEKLVDYIERKL